MLCCTEVPAHIGGPLHAYEVPDTAAVDGECTRADTAWFLDAAQQLPEKYAGHFVDLHLLPRGRFNARGGKSWGELKWSLPRDNQD